MILAADGASLGFPILTAIVVLPVIAAVLVLFTPRRNPEYAQLLAGAATVGTAALTIWLLSSFETGESGFQFVSKQTWIEPWGISWHLGVDGISLFLVALTAFIFPLVILGIDPEGEHKSYLAWMLLLEAGVLGTFLSLDLFMFFLFFEIIIVPMYFLVAGWGHEEREYAATKFFLYTMFGSAFMLVGVVATALIARDSLGYLTFDLVEIAEGANFATSTGRWLFFAFAIAFAVKVPIVPVHTWLPLSHTQAGHRSVILAGVLLKLGSYGLVRFGIYLFPEAAFWDFTRYLFLTLAVVGIIYGAIAATMQPDLKMLVAYSSVAHMGFIILGTFAFTEQGLTGATLQNVNHGVSTGALFLLVGWMYERQHTRMIADFNGIQTVAPIFAAGFMIVMLSSIGVPGLNGFVGEFLILLGSWNTARWWTIVGTTGVILAALYLLWAYQRTFHGVPDEKSKTFPELKVREAAVLLPFIAVIVFTGVYPKPLLDRINPSVDALLEHVEERTDLVRPETEISEEQLERAEIELEAEHGEEEPSNEAGSDEGEDE
ncbi:MAG: NADH-quinone oxidoreductase subunit M [Actinomycetota bacterium]